MNQGVKRGEKLKIRISRDFGGYKGIGVLWYELSILRRFYYPI
jgi:hypothetical protein